jgi:uncharacterized membrane protein YwaF
MLDFLKKFMIDGFNPGDYTMGTVHQVSLYLSGLTIVLFAFLLRKKDADYVNKKMKIIAFVSLFFYLLNRFVRVYQGMSVIEAFWPFYLCNVNTLLLSIYIIFDIKKGKDFFIITGISGAVLAFIIPYGIFNDQYLTLNILDSVLSHYEIVTIPVILLSTKTYQLDIKKSWTVVVGLLLVWINVEFVQPLLTGNQVDYLFLDGTLPFQIPGVNQFFIMFFAALVYVYFVYFLDYLYLGKFNLKRVFKKSNERSLLKEN